MLDTAFEFVAHRHTRLGFVWIALVACLIGRGYDMWHNRDDSDRADGNDGHTTIDFGGQWLFGRVLVTGYPRDLYSRQRHLEVGLAGYGNQADGEKLPRCYPTDLDDPVAGPLYPPVHAFVMAPISSIGDPRLAYRVQQAVMLIALLVAAIGVRYMTRGRWWFSSAAVVLLLFPGARGGLALGQNPSLSIALLVWGWALIVRGRPASGGVLWGLLAFKPVWAVSFLAALVLLGKWRAAVAMAATGAGLVLATLPVVGVSTWLDWLHVGSAAADVYAADYNWIHFSRDLFGLPRRVMLDWDAPFRERSRPVAGAIGWALWAVVAATSVAVVWRVRRLGPAPDFGPRPAFVLFTAWLCTYHFMYYDALVAALGVFVLLGHPREFFRRSWWPFRFASLVVALHVLHENVINPMQWELTARAMFWARTATASDGATYTSAPTIQFGSGDAYAWDTIFVATLWAWCGLQSLGRTRPGSSDH